MSFFSALFYRVSLLVIAVFCLFGLFGPIQRHDPLDLLVLAGIPGLLIWAFVRGRKKLPRWVQLKPAGVVERSGFFFQHRRELPWHQIRRVQVSSLAFADEGNLSWNPVLRLWPKQNQPVNLFFSPGYYAPFFALKLRTLKGAIPKRYWDPYSRDRWASEDALVWAPEHCAPFRKGARSDRSVEQLGRKPRELSAKERSLRS